MTDKVSSLFIDLSLCFLPLTLPNHPDLSILEIHSCHLNAFLNSSHYGSVFISLCVWLISESQAFLTDKLVLNTYSDCYFGQALANNRNSRIHNKQRRLIVYSCILYILFLTLPNQLESSVPDRQSGFLNP